jgi:hypothetical protein
MISGASQADVGVLERMSFVGNLVVGREEEEELRVRGTRPK